MYFIPDRDKLYANEYKMKFRKGDIVDFTVPFNDNLHWLGGRITKIEYGIGYTVEVMYDLSKTEIGQSYLIYFSDEADMCEHDETRFKDEVSKTNENINFQKIADEHWRKHDYVVAILPTKEEDAKLGYTLGFEDGFNEGVKYIKQRIKELIDGSL